MKRVDKWLYDENGRLISATVDVIVCSPTTSGNAVDPTTRREYSLICECGVYLFAEGIGMDELRCKGCDKLFGVRKPEGILQ
jgi:hypothetical protein